MQISITLINKEKETDIAVNSKQIIKDTLSILGVKCKKVYSQRQQKDVETDKNYDDNGIFYGDKLEVRE